jgi:hypothetical protein
MKMKSMIVLGLGVMALFSCDKEEATISPVDNVVNNRSFDYDELGAYLDMTGREKDDEFARFYDEMTETRTQNFVVEANRPFTITGADGTVLSSPDGDWRTADGDRIEGEVRFELIEVFNKADMILLDKATSGVTEDGTAIDALISGGEIFVRATAAGTEVELAGALRVEVQTTSPDYDMIKFVEADVPGDDLLWEVADDPTMDVEEREGEGEGDFVTAYDILPGEWGWTNIDKWAADPCAKTDIFVDVPAGHDASNTEVYLSYDGDPGRLANFDMWDSTVDMFTEHYGQICIGLDCHFVAVSNAGGSLEYAIQGATIVNGHIEVIGGFTPISEAALIAAINALP